MLGAFVDPEFNTAPEAGGEGSHLEGAAATDASTCLEFNTALDAWSECTHREGAAATDGLTFLHKSAARWVSSTYRVGANRISIHFSADG